jgi:hypothetical protein
MTTTTDDQPTLEQDATLDETLRRVAYEAGMMLGLEATRDEQQYHRRRLTRHQYWLHGYGTLAGMAVSMDPTDHDDATETVTVHLIVSPGLGIDGLGREVLIHEPYCIDLGQWLAAQTETHLREGYDDDQDRLYLNVMVRQKDCPVAAQPVLARKLNLSTDAVQPSRIADSVLLELVPGLPEAVETLYRPWACHAPVEDALPSLTTEEQATLDAATGQSQAQLALHARLLHALNTNGVATRHLADDLEEGARLLLARITIQTTDVNAIIVNPLNIAINNLVRPFLVSASQLAWLSRQP